MSINASNSLKVDPVWRSLMFVTVNVERYVSKAHTQGADAIQLDIEDSVAIADKPAARKLIQKQQSRLARRALMLWSN